MTDSGDSRRDAADRLIRRAEDVRREVKSVQRKMRVLGQMAALLEEEADAFIQAADEARPPVK